MQVQIVVRVVAVMKDFSIIVIQSRVEHVNPAAKVAKSAITQDIVNLAMILILNLLLTEHVSVKRIFIKIKIMDHVLNAIQTAKVATSQIYVQNVQRQTVY